MKFEVTELEGLQRQLNVEIEAEVVTEKMEKQFADLRRKLEIKGFRKGKAPLTIIRSNYGESVKAEVIDELINSTYPQAIRENTLNVSSPPKVTDLKFTDEGGFSYTATVEIFPDIKDVSTKGLKVVETPVTVEDSEVDEFIENLRQRHSDFQTVDRVANKDDIIRANLIKIADPGMVLKQDRFEDTRLDLGSAITLAEFREALPGMKKGDQKEIEVHYKKENSDASLAGASVTYRVEVKEVLEKHLPKVDDHFAKATGQAETLLELRLKLRQEIERQKLQRRKQDAKRQIVSQICKNNPLEVPRGTLERYLDGVVDDLKKQDNTVDEKEIREKYLPSAIEFIRWNLLYQNLAQTEKIEVLDADTEKRVKAIAEGYRMPLQQAMQSLRQAGRLDDMKESILEEKVLDFLLEKAEVVKDKQ